MIYTANGCGTTCLIFNVFCKWVRVVPLLCYGTLIDSILEATFSARVSPGRRKLVCWWLGQGTVC